MISDLPSVLYRYDFLTVRTIADYCSAFLSYTSFLFGGFSLFAELFYLQYVTFYRIYSNVINSYQSIWEARYDLKASMFKLVKEKPQVRRYVFFLEDSCLGYTNISVGRGLKISNSENLEEYDNNRTVALSHLV